MILHAPAELALGSFAARRPAGQPEGFRHSLARKFVQPAPGATGLATRRGPGLARAAETGHNGRRKVALP